MNDQLLALFEYSLFFSSLVLIFKAFSALDLSRIFKKGHTLHIQIIYIMTTISLAYIFSRAIVHLIELAYKL
jgi:uncharacterized membrane protein YwzB